jgi:pilus assembly protein FimV
MRRELAYLLSFMLVAPEGAYALGLGSIQRKSALNEPFNATIKLLDARAEELDSLKVRLADPERFQRAGLERSDILSQLRFEVIQADPGSAYIKISSQQPIRDPFLNLLLEVSWSKGQIFREYTVLLDPPLYEPGARMARQVPVPSDRSKSWSEDIAAAPAEMRRDKPYPHRKPRLRAPGVYGPTAPGDTLSEIAIALRPDRSVSMNQVMLALLSANPHAFFQDNVNNLHKGMVLRLPDIATVKSISQAEALAQVRQQHILWEQYRSGMLAAPAPRPIGAGPAEGRGEGTQGTAVGLRQDEAQLKLVSPSAASSVTQAALQAPAEGAGKVQNELALTREELETVRQENAELNTKLAEADNLIKLLQRKLEINDDKFAALQAKVGAGRQSAPVPAPAEISPSPTVLGSQETQPAELTPKPEAQPGENEPEQVQALQTPAATPGEKIEPSTTEQLASPAVETSKEKAKTGVVEEMAPKGVLEALPGGVITLAVILAILVLGLLAALITRRLKGRQKAEAPVEEPHVAFAGRQQATKRSDIGLEQREAISEDRGRALESTVLSQPPQPLETAAVKVEKGEVAPLPVEEEGDPLAEVNIYLAYERFDQAAEVVKQAIQDHPDKHEYKLRLLEVYYAANDKSAYEEHARSLYDAVGGKGPLWESALAMWREMSPGRALFTREVGEAPVQEREASTQFIDITHTGEALAIPAMGATLAGMTKTDSGVDFDLTAAPEDLQQISAADPAREGTVKAESELDFDLTAASRSQGDGEDIEDIFDLTSTPTPGTKWNKDLFDLTAANKGSDQPGVAGTAGASEDANAEGGEMDIFDISMANIKPTLEPALASAPDMRDISLPGEERLFSNLANPLKFSGGEEDFIDFSGGYFAEEGDIFDLTASGKEWPKSAVSSANESDLQAQRDSSEQRREDELKAAKDDNPGQDPSFDTVDLIKIASTKESEGDGTQDLLNMMQSLSIEERKSLGDLQRLAEDSVIASAHPINEERDETETEEPEEEMDVKLNLAKAYMELGDVDGARSILDEVTQEGTEGQKKEARQLLNEL